MQCTGESARSTGPVWGGRRRKGFTIPLDEELKRERIGGPEPTGLALRREAFRTVKNRASNRTRSSQIFYLPISRGAVLPAARCAMIARFRVLLPFTLYIRSADHLEPFEFSFRGYRTKAYPPMLAVLNQAETQSLAIATNKLIEQIRRAETQTSTNWIIMDGAPSIPGNLIQIDFLKDDFDRRRLESLTLADWTNRGDPPIVVAFEASNRILSKIRAVARGGVIKYVDLERDWWRLDYLTDSEEEFPDDPALIRRKFGAPFNLAVTGVSSSVWAHIQELPPDYVPPGWDNLLLDAEALLPNVGASIVAVNAALEVFIKSCLDRLISGSSISPKLWEWINERNDWRKQPSVSEQFDVLLEVCAGRSLMEEPTLWEAFRNLREARNEFVHKGKPIIGGSEVTVSVATRLINRANEIVNWVEALLPADQRRPRLTKSTEWRIRDLLHWPET